MNNIPKGFDDEGNFTGTGLPDNDFDEDEDEEIETLLTTEKIYLSLMFHHKHYGYTSCDVFDLANEIYDNKNHKYRKLVEELVPCLPKNLTKQYYEQRNHIRNH